MKESFFNARKLSAMPNEEHRKSQWTFGKFSSKIIGAKLQFSKALITMCIMSWNVYYAHFVFSTLALQIYWESDVRIGCAVHAKWFALNDSPPLVADRGEQSEAPCASAGWDVLLRHTQAMSWAPSVPAGDIGFILGQPGGCSAQATAGISFGFTGKLAQESSQAGRIQLEEEEKVTKETWAGTWWSCSEQCKLIT